MSLVCELSFTILILWDFFFLDFFFVFMLSFDDSLLVLLPVVYALELRDVSPEVLEFFEVLHDLDVPELFDVLRDFDLDIDEFLLLILDSCFFCFDLEGSLLD